MGFLAEKKEKRHVASQAIACHTTSTILLVAKQQILVTEASENHEEIVLPVKTG